MADFKGGKQVRGNSMAPPKIYHWYIGLAHIFISLYRLDTLTLSGVLI